LTVSSIEFLLIDKNKQKKKWQLWNFLII
jgi:hypothetical protein